VAMRTMQSMRFFTSSFRMSKESSDEREQHRRKPNAAQVVGGNPSKSLPEPKRAQREETTRLQPTTRTTTTPASPSPLQPYYPCRTAPPAISTSREAARSPLTAKGRTRREQEIEEDEGGKSGPLWQRLGVEVDSVL
jgi:hypothetical protein